MAKTDRSPGSIPPSARPERQGQPQWLARDWPVWPEEVVGGANPRSLQKLLAQLRLIEAHAAKKVDLVMCAREPGPHVAKLIEIGARELTQADRDAGLASDHAVRLAGSRQAPAPATALRELVVVPANPSQGPVHLLTTLIDVVTWLIDLLDRNRGQAGPIFRRIKSYARFDQLVSQAREGVLLNFSVAIIGVILMNLQTGSRPSKTPFSLMGLGDGGSASREEIMPILRERERRDQLERGRLARKRAGRLE